MASGSVRKPSLVRGAYLIELSHIQNDPTQPRKKFDEQALTELSDSIRRHGVIQPISVRYLTDEKAYQIISGERRYQASNLAGLETNPLRDSSARGS